MPFGGTLSAGIRDALRDASARAHKAGNGQSTSSRKRRLSPSPSPVVLEKQQQEEREDPLRSPPLPEYPPTTAQVRQWGWDVECAGEGSQQEKKRARVSVEGEGEEAGEKRDSPSSSLLHHRLAGRSVLLAERSSSSEGEASDETRGESGERKGSEQHEEQHYSEDEDDEEEEAVNSEEEEERRKTAVVNKFFRRRYSLFSRFDEGTVLDYESWFSVTPEVLAKHTASRLQCDVVFDCFCGAGGSAIQLAERCEYVFACEIDPAKVELARHNAAVYGVSDRIEFCVGDVRRALAGFSRAGPHGQRRSDAVDVVYLAPPWGGPAYTQQGEFDLCRAAPQPALGRGRGGGGGGGGAGDSPGEAVLNLFDVFSAARQVTENICMLLPKTTRVAQIVEMMEQTGGLLPCEVEKNEINGFLIAITVYFGDYLPSESTFE
jgi:trimethylguanosine synthase